MLILRNNRVATLLITQLSAKTLPIVSKFPQHLSILASAANVQKVRLTPELSLVHPCRYKSKKKKTKTTAETESEPEEEDGADAWDQATTDKNSKLINANVSALRVDALLRSGLGIARNKVETLFYENKIRLNGQPLQKKAENAQEGDEIDIVKEVNPKNPDLLTVARVEVLGIKPKEEGYKVKLRRCKNLVVENYLK